MNEKQKETVAKLKKVRHAQRLMDAHTARLRVARIRLKGSEDRVEYYEECEKKQLQLQLQLINEIDTVEKIFSNVDDEEKRLILELYFVDCYTIEEISEILGYSLRQMFRKYKNAVDAVIPYVMT